MVGINIKSLTPTQPSSILPQQASSTNRYALTEALIYIKNMSKLQSDETKAASVETLCQIETNGPQYKNFIKNARKPTEFFTL